MRNRSVILFEPFWLLCYSLFPGIYFVFSDPKKSIVLFNKFENNSVKILYTLPINTFTLITDREDNIFIAKVIKFEDTKIDPKYVGKKMRRNEPCFCGSGKKYKHCCETL